MSVLFSPFGNQQFSASGTALAVGHKLYTYAAGSSTPLATYTDSTGAIAQTNPIILNSLGMPTNGQIWLTSGLAYKLVWTDAFDVVIKTEDNITGVTGAASVSQWQASGLTPTYVSATSFTLAGDQTSEFHVGRRLQSTNTAGTVYSTITASAYGVLTTVTVVNDGLSVLDSGLSQVNYGLLTATNPSTPRVLSISSVNGGQIGGFRNLIVNGNFGINQRAVSGTVVLAAGAYGHDRFKAGASGCTYTFATSNNVTTITISEGSLQQVVEGLNLQSGTHVLSWSGTAQGRADGGAYGASGAVTATAVGGTNMTVEFATGTVSKVQLEAGTVASAFEQRLYGLELSLCQRYYRTSYNGVAAGSASATGGVGVISLQANRPFNFVTFDDSMRSTPTVTTYNPTTGTASQCDFGGSGVTLTMGEVVPKGFSLFAAGSPGTHGGYFHYTAAAEL